MRSTQPDPFVGVTPWGGYELKRKVGSGKIGSVYRAVRPDPQDTLACKVVEEGRLKLGYERELQKVSLLRGIPNVVQYHHHGASIDKQQRPFIFIFYDFIEGVDLKKCLNTSEFSLDCAFLDYIGRTILQVLYACRAVGIEHGDLHVGNILISNPDPRIPGSPRGVWISDFGCGGSHNQLEPKNDMRQFFSIVSNLIGKIQPASLNPRDRIWREKTAGFLQKRVLEIDRTQGAGVGDPGILLQEFNMLGHEAERESATGKGGGPQDPGDYLNAEALGYRVAEWKNLFVPEFPAAQDLLSRNVTVLTGARGCGKTMSFRRLTLFMDKVIGEPSGVKGADQFLGFYLNCRNLVEAFPWVPRRLTSAMKQQIIHYFHLAWFSEVCNTLGLCQADAGTQFEWLDPFLLALFGAKYRSLPSGADVLAHARAFLENEKENCRLVDLGSESGTDAWPLSRLDFLDRLQELLESKVSSLFDRPLYFFLDDFTIPIVTREVQEVLNPIIFKRRDKLFFKVSTEATNSFNRRGIRGKPLELHEDFELIDLATESLHQDTDVKAQLLDSIFRPRIDRHPLMKGKEFHLEDVLGRFPYDNNKLAHQIRGTPGDSDPKKVYYHGAEAFVGMWASDIRIMIQMFGDMLREANGELKKELKAIDKTIQDKIFRAAGGEFLTFCESLTDPHLWEKGPSSTRPGEKYGMHLRDIAEAFVKVANLELTEAPLVSNEGRLNPKQAFRLEVLDRFELSEKAVRYYGGLVRWHIFLQDWRGKSVRGMITPRLYLNRVLLPFSNLTFSSHDNIPLLNQELVSLLETPKDFPEYWKRKMQKRQKEPSQSELFDPAGPGGAQ